MRATLASVLLILVAGCGSGPASNAMVSVSGKVHVDSMSAVRTIADKQGRATDYCKVPDFASKNVVISDSSGKKVALWPLPKLGKGDKLDDSQFYGGVPGTCNLDFRAEVPKSAGVYTATIEGTGFTTSFTADGAADVVITAK